MSTKNFYLTQVETWFNYLVKIGALVFPKEADWVSFYLAFLVFALSIREYYDLFCFY